MSNNTVCDKFYEVNLYIGDSIQNSRNSMRTNIFLLFFFFTINSIAQDIDLSIYPYWKYYGNVSNSLYETISERGFERLDNRKEEIHNLETLYDWKVRQRDVKVKLEKIFGPFPEKNPLNPVITGTLERSDFTVENLYFESMPGYYVTSALFLPREREGKVPAIIYCSGHTENGYRSETYQHIIMNYVKKGFAVLAIDPIGQGERIQYLENGKPRFGATHEHSYPGSQAILAGITPGKYFIWDGIRAVDYLLSRPEIDGERIGITGRSGGGTQSAYIAAMDDRILASAPECYITTFDKLYRSIGPQDAEQNWIGGISEGLDMADLIEVRAPKPTMIIGTTRDFFNIQGAKDSYLESKRIFEAYGKENQLQMAVDDDGHASTKANRESAYKFFQTYLSNPGSAQDEETEPFSEEELWVTKTGNIFTSLKGKNMHALILEDYLSKKSSSVNQKSISKEGGKSKFVFEGEFESVFSGRYDFESYTLEKYLVGKVGKYPVPLIWYRPKSNTIGKAVILLRENGKDDYKGSTIPMKLIDKGYHVLVPDLSGIGELGGGFDGGDARIGNVPLNVWYGGAMTGLLPVEIRSREIDMIIDFLKSQMDDISLYGAAEGFLVGDLLLASFNNMFDGIVLDGSTPAWKSVLENVEYNPKYLLSSFPGSVYGYDLPDLIENNPCPDITILRVGDSSEESGMGIDTENYSRKGLEKAKVTTSFDEGVLSIF